MPKRTRTLFILLGLTVAFYVYVEVDWMAPVRYYQNYQQLKALAHREDQLNTALAKLREKYGASAGMSYKVTTDFKGTFTQTLQATRGCGALDDQKFLDDAKKFFREAGLGKADRVEYLYGCDAPLTYGMGLQAFDQAMNAGLKEHSWCRQISTSQNLNSPGGVSQIWSDKSAGVLARLHLDEDGLISKGQWLNIPTSAEQEAQFRLMVCMTRGAMRVLEPSVSEDDVKKLMSAIWFSQAKSASVAVGRYTFDSQMQPFGFTVKRVRKD